jgi:GNAT superfamily N-acetyltransferase
MKCHYDDQVAHYRCAQTGEYVCLDHSRIDVVSVATRIKRQPLPVRQAGPEDCATVRDLAMMYWGETQVECFDRTFDVAQLPAFVAHSDGEVAGVLSFAVVEGQMIIVMLNVHPEFQGRHTARSLLARAEREARSRGLFRLVVTTTNDDLPALYLYQRWGFVITEVRSGAILAHHGREEPGFAAIPVRDEIRLEKLVRG